jgi:hypothetical protein
MPNFWAQPSRVMVHQAGGNHLGNRLMKQKLPSVGIYLLLGRYDLWRRPEF